MFFAENEQYPLTALVVDDSVVMRRIVCDILEPIIKSIETANDGLAALEMVENNSYDIIITDINMPHLNGIELVKELRSRGFEIPIFVISSESDQKYFIELINQNISGFLAKPPIPDTVRKLINRICSGIVDRRLVIEYQQQLQQRTQELEEMNQQLLRSIKIMDKKNQSFAHAISDTDTSIEYNYFTQLNPEDAENLYHYAMSIEHHATKIFSAYSQLSYDSIINALKGIAKILFSYIDFHDLGEEVDNFQDFLTTHEKTLALHHEDISYTFGSFISTFKTYLDSVWKEKASHPNVYDAALIKEMNNFKSYITQH